MTTRKRPAAKKQPKKQPKKQTPADLGLVHVEGDPDCGCPECEELYADDPLDEEVYGDAMFDGAFDE